MERRELVEHYEGYDEQGRLTRAPSLELIRTRLLLQAVLPPAPARILDVGGGAGVHAAWLAELGHTVHLVDPVARHVAQASSIGTFSAAVGDACDLVEPDDTYDLVLLLGPLYHLTDRAERLQALHEARRVARPEAPVAVAAFPATPAPWTVSVAGSSPTTPSSTSSPRTCAAVSAATRPGTRGGSRTPSSTPSTS